jgi:hypothetical protein
MEGQGERMKRKIDEKRMRRKRKESLAFPSSTYVFDGGSTHTIDELEKRQVGIACSRAEEEAARRSLEVVLEVLEEFGNAVAVEEGSFADSDVLLICVSQEDMVSGRDAEGEKRARTRRKGETRLRSIPSQQSGGGHHGSRS